LLLSGYYHIVDKQEIQLEKVYFQGHMDRYQYETQLTTTSPLMKKAWADSEYYMDMLIKDATSHNIPVLVLGLPSRAQIIPDEWQTIKKKGLLSDQRLYADSASRKQLLYLCQKHHWTCLDLQDDLRNTDDPKKDFLGSDIHFSPLGNAIAGKAIYNFLTKTNEMKLGEN
jgi:hypothetical protein